MSKLSTKLRQKQSIVPQQIIKSRLLELSVEELEKDLENEIQINPVLEEKSIQESKAVNEYKDGFADQGSYDLFLANIPEKKDKIRKYVMQLNPNGIASRDLQEYLTFQLNGINNLSTEIVKNHFNQFLSQDIKAIKDTLDSDPEEIDQALLLIAEQNFSPIFDVDLGDENIIPDAVLKLKDDGWLILINDSFLNKYQISQDY